MLGSRLVAVLSLAVCITSAALRADDQPSCDANAQSSQTSSEQGSSTWRDYCKCCCPCTCDWYARVDALILTRVNNSFDRPVVIADDTRDTVLSTHDLQFGYNAGPRIFIGREKQEGGWELGYFGLYGSQATASAHDPNNLDIPLPLSSVATDFDNADTMNLKWNFNISNAEANVFDTIGSYQVLFGFRYFNLNEKFNIHAIDSDGDQSDYNINATNNLYGGQFGVRTCCQHGRWDLWLTGKAGIYASDAREHQIVRDNNNTFVVRDAVGSDVRPACVSDIDLSLGYKLADHLRLRGGYYFLLVTDLAYAPNQLDFSFNADSGTHIQNTSTMYLYGATAGIEAMW